MSHGIRETDKVFAVRDAGWHGLAEPFPDYPTREEAQQFAHPWEPVEEPVYAKVTSDKRGDGVLSVGFREVDGFKMLSRSDNHQPLSVVSDTYRPVLNSEMYDIAEAIEGGDPKQVKYETGGSLYAGRKVWLLLRLREPVQIKGDNGPTILYYALQNSMDGSGAFRGQATMTKIICDNTAQMADLDSRARGTEFVFRHTKNIKARIEEAQQALTGWRHSIEEWQLLSEHLIGLTITPEQRREFVDRFIPSPPPGLTSDRVQNNVAAAREEMWSIFQSPTMSGIDLTAYGLVQASIEYAQHYRRARTSETRFKRAYLDRSAITATAVSLAQEVSA